MNDLFFEKVFAVFVVSISATGLLKMKKPPLPGSTAAGVAVGLAGAIALTRVIRSLLYGVSATDPLILAAVSVVLTAVAALAGFFPARRAARIDSIEALRCE